MDFLNFIFWIKDKRIVKTVDPNRTLLAVGIKDNKRLDDYLAGAITVADFAAQVATGATGPQGIAGPNLVTTGVTLANIGSANQVLFSDGANVQGNTRFIYDAAGGYFNNSGRTVDNTNSAVGFAALSSNVSGINNTVVGWAAGGLISTANNNTAIGNGSLANTTIGNNNTSVGIYSLLNNTTGLNNIAIGASASNDNITGSFNTVIGGSAQTGNFDASVVIGYLATATANNQFVVGSAGANAGAVTTAVQAQTKYWDVIINGVAQKILLG